MYNKFFIDCGANTGQSIDNFIKKWPDWKEYMIMSYEADPRLLKFFNKYSNLENVKFEHAAIWTYDGTVDFFIAQSNTVGSSIIGTKDSGNLHKIPIQIKCIDIDRIIKEINSSAYVILKIDIEGAEYELLDYMLRKNTFEHVNELYIEFHTSKVFKTIEDNKILLNQLNTYPNLKVFHDTWHGLNFI